MDKSLRDRVLKTIKDRGLVDEKSLDDVIKEVKKKKEGDVISKLIENKTISDKDLLIILSGEMGIPPVDITKITLDADVMGVIPEKLSRRYSIIPLSKIGNDITVAVSDPTDIIALDDVKTVTGCNVRLMLATESSLIAALRNFYEGEEEDISSIIKDEDGSDVEVVTDTERIDIGEVTEESTAAPIVKMVDLIITESIKKRASDIHIEPQEKSLRVRYRVDGELHDVFDLPKKNQNAILARIKIMSKLDITESRVPQDGRFRVKMGKKEIDFRVSVLPTNAGNKIVLRALDKSNLSVGMETLGFLPGPLADFKEALSKPFGIILVTGPTGSGKSTTLYSVLNEMNTPEKNIITIEDPVEYQLAGITQMAANPDIGLDFATGLRALLRQSPDVIMVGEIRDLDTADIAIKASLTGHMVLSTLHTNDAVGAITRLVNIGVEPFLVASSLVMSCAQRLLRKICPHCKTEIQIPDEVIKEVGEKYPKVFEIDRFYVGSGCPKCNGTGYRGRLGTLETVLVGEDIREMINKRESEEKIKEFIRARGFKSLRDNAMEKFILGWTTLEEVLRVT